MRKPLEAAPSARQNAAPTDPPEHERHPGRGVGRAAPCAVLCLAIFFATLFTAPAYGGENHEEGLLGLYLYNFLLFVDWPAEAFTDGDTITIGVLGNADGPPLFTRLHGKSIKGKELVIRNVSRVNDLERDWHVIFVRDGNPSRAAQAVDRLKNSHCLTISDIAGFTELGGMVEFTYPSRAGIKQGIPAKRFRIQLDVVLDAGLRIRSRLLRLSDVLGKIPNATTSAP
jgi:hypothetical protein